MTPISHLCFRITVKGLKGGHSGGDIHLGRGNANKILNRFLYQMMTTYQEDFHLYEFNGGNLRQLYSPCPNITNMTYVQP
jgi:dipeptidase D